MKVLVLLPTYNEAENIQTIIEEILKIGENLEVLVIDDNSPDGTAQIVRKIEGPRIHLIVNEKRLGRGKSEIVGLQYAFQKEYDYIIEMDADFSHPPQFIPDLLEKIRDYDGVIGSRYIEGGRDSERGILRRLVSFFARKYLQILLGIKVKDPTSGYRCFRKSVLESIVKYLSADDPFIVTESLYYCIKKGFRICEIPITFEERKKGKSKLNLLILIKYLFRAFKLRYKIKVGAS